MFSALQLAFSLGFLIALPLVFFTLAGVWLDTRMNTMPIFTLGGTIVGTIVALLIVMRKILPLLEQKSEKKE